MNFTQTSTITNIFDIFYKTSKSVTDDRHFNSIVLLKGSLWTALFGMHDTHASYPWSTEDGKCLHMYMLLLSFKIHLDLTDIANYTIDTSHGGCIITLIKVCDNASYQVLLWKSSKCMLDLEKPVGEVDMSWALMEEDWADVKTQPL